MGHHISCIHPGFIIYHQSISSSEPVFAPIKVPYEDELKLPEGKACDGRCRCPVLAFNAIYHTINCAFRLFALA